MDFPVIPASTLNIQQLYRQQDSKQGSKPLPFTQGQMLQGTIIGKSDNNSYLLDIGGKQLQAESTALLQTGQKLDLHVTAVSPRVELQVVSDPLPRQIGATLHALDGQKTLLQNISQLSRDGNTTGLSQAAKQTLSFFSQSAVQLNPSAQQSSAPISNALLTTVIQSLQSNPATTPQTTRHLEVLLQTILPAFSQETTAANQTGQLLDRLSGSTSLALAVSGKEQGIPLALLEQTISSALQTPQKTFQLARQLVSLFSNNQSLLPTSELHTILSLALSLPSVTQPPAASPPDGQQLQQLVERLGLNMEQLFAQNKGQEATQTLKFALLELGQQLTGTNIPSGEQTGQILQTLELYQMLQLRLANEFLFFLPLPLPFLDQGYLLVDKQPEQEDGKSNESKENSLRYTLHLKLEGLGSLRIEMQQTQERLDLRFFAEDQDKMIFMHDHKEELAKWLTAVDLGSTQFFAGADDPAKTLLQKIVTDSTRVINTKA